MWLVSLQRVILSRTKAFYEIKLCLSIFPELKWHIHWGVNKGLLEKLQCLQNTNLNDNDYRLSKANLYCQMAIVGPPHQGSALMPPAGFLKEAFQLWWYFSSLWKKGDLEARETRIWHCYLLCVTLEKCFSLSILIKMERLIVPVKFGKELNKNGA